MMPAVRTPTPVYALPARYPDVPLTTTPTTYRTTRMEPAEEPIPKKSSGFASASARKQPSKEILSEFRDAGQWVAVSSSTVRDMLDLLTAAQQVFTDAFALMDLHYWIDRGDVKPYKYYAQRWHWPERKTYEFFVKVGIYKTAKERSQSVATAKPERSQSVAGDVENGTESNETVARAKLNRSQSVATAKQYVPDSDSDSEEKSSGGVAPEGREPDDEERVFNPGYTLPTLEQVLDFAATHSIPADIAEDIFYSYAKSRWKDVAHWGYALINAYRHRSKTSDPKTNKRNGSSQPASTGPNTTEEFYAGLAAEVRRTSGGNHSP